MYCFCKRHKSIIKSEINKDCIGYVGKIPKKINEDDYTFSCSNQTLIKSPNSIPKGYPILILDSKNSNFYILDASVQIILENLDNCTLILGPTESSVFIRDCKNTRFYLYCQQFRARDCVDLTVFLYCTTDPIIESSKNIKFSPNTLKYDGLESQLLKSGLKDKANKWNLIYDFNDSWPKNYSTISENSTSLDTSLLLDFKISI